VGRRLVLGLVPVPVLLVAAAAALGEVAVVVALDLRELVVEAVALDLLVLEVEVVALERVAAVADLQDCPLPPRRHR
jgi:hypothetical protein